MRQYAAWIYVPCTLTDDDGEYSQIRCEIFDWLEGIHEFTLQPAECAAVAMQEKKAA